MGVLHRSRGPLGVAVLEDGDSSGLSPKAGPELLGRLLGAPEWGQLFLENRDGFLLAAP